MMVMRRWPAIAAVLAVGGGSLAWAPPSTAVQAPGPGPSGAVASANFDDRIARLLSQRVRNPRLGGDVSVRVLSPFSTRVIFAAQPKQAQLPASNMKLVTALGALTVLGQGRQLATRVALRDKGSGVVLVGGGDPLLTGSDLDALARETMAALTSQTGGKRPSKVRVFLNDRLFNDSSRAPGWRPDYVPGEVTFVRALGRRGVRVVDTGREAGLYFAARLRAKGVAVNFRGRGAGGLGPILAARSHSVAAAVQVMLRDSDNQVAEVLFRQVALGRGRAPTWTGARKAAEDTLDDRGISRGGVTIRDGSGLSRSDRLSALATSQLLAVVQGRSEPSLRGMLGWLPVAGRTGTLAPYAARYVTWPTRCAAGKVHAKTGTLTGALALSGVAEGRDGRTRVFSILVNHPPTGRYGVLAVRRAMDELATTITGCW